MLTILFVSLFFYATCKRGAVKSATLGVLLIASTLNSGCGSSQPDTSYTDHELRKECNIECIGKVTSDVPIYCDNLQRNIGKARNMLVTRGIVSNEEFCEVYKDLPIHIRKECIWDDFVGEQVVGTYYWYEGIKLNPTGEILLHEMLHHLDVSKFVLNTMSHPDWDKKGYTALAENFWDRAERINDPQSNYCPLTYSSL